MTEDPDFAAIMASENPMLSMLQVMPDEALEQLDDALTSELQRRGLLVGGDG